MRRRAFTLIELMIVVVLIAILVAFILRAAMGGIKVAEQKATLSLIAKLEAGMTDRVDALASQHPEPTAAHYVLAQIYNGMFVIPPAPPDPGHPWPNPAHPAAQRAQVIAQYDMLRAELPDVFVVQAAPSGSGDKVYPLNFGGVQYGNAGNFTDYLLPLGSNSVSIAGSGSTYDYASYLVNQPQQANEIGITPQNTGAMPDGRGGLQPIPSGGVRPTGIYGASFAAAAAIYRQLGYGPQGTDGADNDGDGDIDDLQEGLIGQPAGTINEIATKLANHKHETARAAMLYAVLIEGTGPLGSVFQKDDFNSREIADTDNDGLLEFVDAWGKPLQFFRWPILYRSDVQRGFPDLVKIQSDIAASRTPGPYSSVYEAREGDTLDTNQQLVNPAWWSAFNIGPPGWASGQGTVSKAAIAFQTHFHSLVDPLAISAGSPSLGTFWDRSTATTIDLRGTKVSYFPRRAYYTRFLILSGGADKIPGVAMLGVDYSALDDRSQFPLPNGSTASARDGSGTAVSVLGPNANIAQNIMQIENQAGRVDPNRSGPFYVPSLPGGRNDTNTFLEYAGQDDITSQNLNSLGGPASQ